MHNLVDGIVIGIAFSYCSSNKGWAIAAATIGHEIAQELGDYVVMTVRAGMRPAFALGVNFVAGLTVFLGVIIAMAGDPSQEVRMAQGYGIFQTLYCPVRMSHLPYTSTYTLQSPPCSEVIIMCDRVSCLRHLRIAQNPPMQCRVVFILCLLAMR